jgi:MFS family permease
LSIFIINLLAAVFVGKFESNKTEPEQLTQKTVTDNHLKEPLPSVEQTDYSFKAILKNPLLWLYILVNIFQQGLTYMSNVSIILNSIAGNQDKGWVSSASSTHVTILSVGQSVGRFVFGYVSSQSDVKKYKFLGQTRLLLYIEFILIIPCLFLTLIQPTNDLMYIYSAIIGLGWGASAGLFPGLTNKFFGMKMYGTACGLIMAGVPLGIIAANQSFGALYDAAGGDNCQYFCFRNAFLVSTVFQSLCIGFTFLLCIMFSKKSISLYLL